MGVKLKEKSVEVKLGVEVEEVKWIHELIERSNAKLWNIHTSQSNV